MNEEFIVEPKTKLVAVTIVSESGEKSNMALAFHNASKAATGPYWYAKDSNIEALNFTPVDGQAFYFNDRVLAVAPDVLKATLERMLQIEEDMYHNKATIKKHDAAEAFSFLYHLINPAHPKGARVRGIFDDVFKILDMGEVLPARPLLISGLSEMQRTISRAAGVAEI
jgi:hypothetical protein